MLQLIDTHCHLNLGQYETDQAEIIEEALKAGVSQIVTPGVTLESFSSALKLSEAYPGTFYTAVGVHPTEAAQFTAETYAYFLAQARQHKSVVAVGETGLDYYWDQCPEDIQQEALRRHIHLAKECQLPLILHIRDKNGSERAYQDLLDILKEENASEIGGVMHCFSGSLSFAREAISQNFFLAYGGVLTFKNAPTLHEVADAIDLQHVVLETDSPWLTPSPHRGKRNAPAYVQYIAQKLAEIKRISVEEVAQITTQNAKLLFKLP